MSNTATAKRYINALLSVAVPRAGFSAMLQEQRRLLRRIPPPGPPTHERQRRGQKSGVSKQRTPSQADRAGLTKRKDPHGQADRAGMNKRKDQQGRRSSDNEKAAGIKNKLTKRKASRGDGMSNEVETKSQKLKRRMLEQKTEKQALHAERMRLLRAKETTSDKSRNAERIQLLRPKKLQPRRILGSQATIHA